MLILSRYAPIWLAGPSRRRSSPAPANQPPVANPDTATVTVNTATLIPVRTNDTDPEGGALTLVSATTATGTAVVQSGQILYTPPTNFAGAATISYVVADPLGATATGTVSVTVAWPQPAFTTQPSFGAASYTVGNVLALNLGAAGPNATLSVEVFSLGSASRIAELTGTGATRSWDSTGETAETVSLRVRATNPSGFVLSNTVTVPLGAVANQPPVANPDTATVTVNTATLIPVRTNDTDPEGGALTLVSATTATGTAVVQSGQVLYTPPSNFAGAATISYVVADPLGATATGTVSVNVVWPQPAFTTQPSFGAASYTVGNVLALNLGAAGPNATLSVEVFSLGSASRISELTGTGATRSWDSTGEAAETVSLRVRATNPGGFVLSNTVTVPLGAAATPPAALDLQVLADATFQGDATGTVDVVVTSTPGFNGTHVLNADALASGPVALLSPQIMLLADADSSGAVSVGDLVGVQAPFTPTDRPGLFAFDPARGTVAASWVWQRDTGGNGTFADIAGAPSEPTRSVLAADVGNQLRLGRRLVQAAATVTSWSNALTVPSARSVSLQPVLSYNDVQANVHSWPAGFSASTGETIVLAISARSQSGPQGVASVTIGGQAMTFAGNWNGVLTGHAIRQLTAPISPTDQIVVTYAATGLYPASHVRPYRCAGYAGSFFATGFAQTSVNAASLAATVDIPANGAVFASHTTGNPAGTLGDTTVTGATLNFDQVLPLAGIRRTNIAHATDLPAATGRVVTFAGVQVAQRLTHLASLAPTA